MDLTLTICVYNAEKYIEETLESVIAQTVQEFHFLIINDCSIDNTVQVIKSYLEIHHRQYELINFNINQGIAYARNYAINHAMTKYMLFIDADDIIDKRLVEKEYTQISLDTDLIGVSCWSEFINENGKRIHGGTYLGEVTKEKFIEKASRCKLIFLPIHTIFDREIAIRCGGFCINGFSLGKPRLQDYCEELDLWTRMSDFYTEGKAFITIPEVLYKYRKSDGLSSNHFYMIIKMRYTKTNLLLRRAGNSELTFTEFYNSLSDQEMEQLKKESMAADALRNGFFYLKKGNWILSMCLILKCIWYRPLYIWEKVKNNFRI